MDDPAVIRLPPLAGGQAESWRALIELAPQLGHHWLLIGGQMVFLHEVERESTDIRPTNDIDLVVDLRIEPAALYHTHDVLTRAGFVQDLPSPEGIAHRYRRAQATIDVLAPDHMGARAALSLGRPTLVGALLGKATAVTEIVSMSSAERAKHVRDVDALARLLGPADRASASLTTKERSTLARIAEHSDISALAARSIQLTVAPAAP